MTRPDFPRALWILILSSALTVIFFTGCSQDSAETRVDESATQQAAAADAPVESVDGPPYVYTIRARVEDIKDTEEMRGILVQHEAIDDWRGIDGKVWGMDSMTMPFLVADDVDLTTLAKDDKISFTLEVDWFSEEQQIVTRVEKLDPATEFEYRPAQPPPSEEDGENGG